TTALRFVHSRLDEIRIIGLQSQSSSEQQFTFTKRSVTIVPLNAVTGNLDNLSFASDPHLFSHSPDLMIVSTSVHPQCTTDCARNAAKSFDSRQPMTCHVDAESRQRITGADR